MELYSNFFHCLLSLYCQELNSILMAFGWLRRKTLPSTVLTTSALLDLRPYWKCPIDPERVILIVQLLNGKHGETVISGHGIAICCERRHLDWQMTSSGLSYYIIAAVIEHKLYISEFEVWNMLNEQHPLKILPNTQHSFFQQYLFDNRFWKPASSPTQWPFRNHMKQFFWHRCVDNSYAFYNITFFYNRNCVLFLNRYNQMVQVLIHHSLSNQWNRE